MTERSLTVCNFVTVDGRYEDDDHDIASFFTHQHPDYRGADDFDHYATSLLRRSDVVLLSGKRSTLGNLGYWTSGNWWGAGPGAQGGDRQLHA